MNIVGFIINFCFANSANRFRWLFSFPSDVIFLKTLTCTVGKMTALKNQFLQMVHSNRGINFEEFDGKTDVDDDDAEDATLLFEQILINSPHLHKNGH